MSDAVTLLRSSADRDDWLELWGATGREPFAHPGYCELIAGTEAEALALAVRLAATTALVPLIRSAVPSPHCDRRGYHVSSPYGYGGPYFAGPQDLNAVLTAIQAALCELGAASAFLRLDLRVVVANRKPDPHVLVRETSDNVIVDLSLTADEQWRRVAHKVRKNVNKARRNGCTVLHDPEFDRLSDFVRIYRHTMDRRQAASWFHFDSSFFERLHDELAGQASLYLVMDSSGDPVSAELVLESATRMYSFLGGTLPDAFAMAPNDLLKYELILSGAARRKKQFVLGGGYRPGDGIFRYKSGFCPGVSHTYWTARIIGDELAFRQLAGIPANDPLDAVLEADFFPPYRHI